MLLYSMLHLTGYGVSLEDVESFRQWGSITPGHPEYGLTPGVEATTGPLGQGLANAVGMAIAERRLAAEFNRDGHELIDHRTYVICSDGDLQEGVASEASSLAGHLKLGKLIALYDDNRIQLDGPTAWAFTEDVLGAVRGLRLARPAGRGRHRPRRDRRGHHGGRGRRPAVDHRRPYGHRLRLARTRPAPRRRTARRSGRTRCASPRRRTAGTRTRRSTCPTRRATCSAGRSTRARPGSPTGSRGWRHTPRRIPARRPSSSGGSRGGSPDGWDAGLPVWDDGTEVATRNASQDAIQAARRGAARAVRRLGRPVGIQSHRRQGERARPLRVRITPGATSASASASTRWAASSTASPTTAGSSRTPRRSSPSATTCAAPSGSRR